MSEVEKPSLLDRPEELAALGGALTGIIGGAVLTDRVIDVDYAQVTVEINHKNEQLAAIRTTEHLPPYDPVLVEALAPKKADLHQQITTLTQEREQYTHLSLEEKMAVRLGSAVVLGLLFGAVCHRIRMRHWNKEQSKPQTNDTTPTVGVIGMNN